MLVVNLWRVKVGYFIRDATVEDLQVCYFLKV